MTQPFKHYINLIGKGQRAGKTLSYADAFDAMQQILQNKVAPEQLGAFLMLLRVREETAEELAAFTQACRAYIEPEYQSLSVDLDIGCYAGKRRHLPWFLLAIMTVAQNGIKIAIHGTSEPDSNRLYIKEVLQFFEFEIAKNPTTALTQIERYGFTYMDLASFHPQLDKLIQLRSLFGLRSPANTLARMLNPFNAEYSLHGVHHRHFDERHAAAAKISQDKNMLCFRGEGGEVEFNPERAATLHISRQGKNETVELPALLDSWQIKPREFDMSDLKALWLGQLNNEYGTQAVIGTIATILVLVKKLDSKDAVAQAEAMWSAREANHFLD